MREDRKRRVSEFYRTLDSQFLSIRGDVILTELSFESFERFANYAQSE